MSAQAATRSDSWSDAICDPLFVLGYSEIWRGDDYAVSQRWEKNERAAYENGRNFGEFVRKFDGCRCPLTRSGTIHPRCMELMALAGKLGWVLG